MRKLFIPLLVLITSWFAVTGFATDLRGQVAGMNLYWQNYGPIAGIPVALFAQTPNGFLIVRQATTGGDGMYYLSGVYPGQYILQIGGQNYPLSVGAYPRQDIPVIYR